MTTARTAAIRKIEARDTGRIHHAPMSRKRAMRSGDNAVPSPSKTFSAVAQRPVGRA